MKTATVTITRAGYVRKDGQQIGKQRVTPLNLAEWATLAETDQKILRAYCARKFVMCNN